ncbi:unnamed protein product [Ambrosiozyma monospora]|uniref:Unnamed protein product n=1 Tax=Ambrosiozyma monospora TaxID=43982 RepID=A0ACB5TM96_AMBMO|nr:unnamed protein product [Ambrosiozyma monospora]
MELSSAESTEYLIKTMSVPTALILAVAIVNLAINKFSLNFEKYLETSKKTKYKPYIRAIYNWNLQLNAILLTTYHKFINPRPDGLLGEYGGEVGHMIVYPIKSATTGFKVTQWEMTQYGLKYDRIYMFAVYSDKTERYEVFNLSKATKLITLKIKSFNGTHFEFDC